jgi:molybdenum-dependent DNA-binding transcriptional regulator ModE
MEAFVLADVERWDARKHVERIFGPILVRQLPGRAARKVFRQVDAEKAMTEYETAQKAFHANRERLKAERLAREAAGTPGAAKKAKTKKKTK